MSDLAADMLDLRFALTGSGLAHDHIDALSQAVMAELAWFAAEPLAALHPLSGLSPCATGWYLSGRTRLSLRVPQARIAAARELAGRTLQVGDAQLHVGAATERPLLPVSVLYAHFVSFGTSADGTAIDETDFLARCREALAALDVTARLICGLAQRAATPAGDLTGFSLMLADLDATDTLRMQQHGLGSERRRGCGIFIPHKSGASVRDIE